MLTPNERERYSRQIMIPEIGEAGQEKLKAARILIAGAGGLGSPIALYLAAAGVGVIRIIDYDQVALSNLNRQILHGEEDQGKRKVDSAHEKLTRLNPSVITEPVAATITDDTARKLVQGMDALVDALDNVTTRYILNKVAIENGIPFFHGAVAGFEGRAMTIVPGKSACLRCMSRGPIPQETFPVIGVAPAVIGSIQATEVIKYIVGAGDLLTDRLLRFDGLAMTFMEFKIKRNPQCDHCGEL